LEKNLINQDNFLYVVGRLFSAPDNFKITEDPKV
jgi:hypothetical protein